MFSNTRLKKRTLICLLFALWDPLKPSWAAVKPSKLDAQCSSLLPLGLYLEASSNLTGLKAEGGHFQAMPAQATLMKFAHQNSAYLSFVQAEGRVQLNLDRKKIATPSLEHWAVLFARRSRTGALGFHFGLGQSFFPTALNTGIVSTKQVLAGISYGGNVALPKLQINVAGVLDNDVDTQNVAQGRKKACCLHEINLRFSDLFNKGCASPFQLDFFSNVASLLCANRPGFKTSFGCWLQLKLFSNQAVVSVRPTVQFQVNNEGFTLPFSCPLTFSFSTDAFFRKKASGGGRYRHLNQAALGLSISPIWKPVSNTILITGNKRLTKEKASWIELLGLQPAVEKLVVPHPAIVRGIFWCVSVSNKVMSQFY